MPLVYGGPYSSDPTNPTDSYVVASYPANERTSRTQAHAWQDEEHDHTNGRHKFVRGTVSQRASFTPVNDGTLFIGSDMISVYDSGAAKWLEYGILRTGDLKVKTSPAVPEGFLLADGAAVSRSTYADLLAVSSIVRTGATSSGFPEVGSLSATADLYPGMIVEGTGIPTGTTILTVDSSSQVTLSANATATGSPSLRFFLFGNGDGATTFNVIDMGGVVPIGYKAAGDADGDYKGIGRLYGAKKHPLTSAESPVLSDHVQGASPVTGGPEGTNPQFPTAVPTGYAASHVHTHTFPHTHVHAYSADGTAHENRQPSRVVAWLVKT